MELSLLALLALPLTGPPASPAPAPVAPMAPDPLAQLATPAHLGARYAVAAETAAGLVPLAAGRLGAGTHFDLAALPPGTRVHGQVAGARGHSGFTLVTGSGSEALEQPQGDLWDWRWGWDAVAQAPGAIVSDTQPWASFATITAVNGARRHPDAAVLVPSDLGAGENGGGAGEAPALHLAIAESVAGDLGQGPEPAGGVLRLDFPGPTLVTSISFANVVGSGGVVRSYQGRELVRTEPIPDQSGSDSWQLFVSYYDVTRIEIEFVGPGEVAGLQLFPHTLRLNFDTTTTGVPKDWQAGGAPVGGYPEIGLFGDIYGVNGTPGHPDLALLFDSEQPSGGDGDLVTPGYGPGNDTPEGLVLIVPEDDVDTNADGLVDDPDDEAGGGVLSFSFVTSNTIFVGVTVIDLDDDDEGGGGSFVRVYDDFTGLAHDFPLPDAGDNGVTVFDTDTGLQTRTIELHLQGSGALAELRLRQPM